FRVHILGRGLFVIPRISCLCTGLLLYASLFSPLLLRLCWNRWETPSQQHRRNYQCTEDGFHVCLSFIEEPREAAALLDIPPPCPGFAPSGLNVVLESLQVPFHSLRHDANHVSCLLDHPFRLILDAKVDLRFALRHRRKDDDPFILRAALAPPGNPLIGNLFGDFRLPFLLLSPDGGFPMEMLVVNLLDLLDSLHEAGEFFKLSPLVIGRTDGNIEVNGFLDDRHCTSLL